MLTVPFFVLLAVGSVSAQVRPPMFFREDWKELAPATPVTQEHVGHPDLIMSLHGPGKLGIKKSHHEKPADDPYYIWFGLCEGNCALSLRHKNSYVDLTGQAKVRWRSKQAGYRQARLLLKLADGTWLVSDVSDGPAGDWREFEFVIGDIRWRKLDIDKVIEGKWVEKPDLSKVDEIGWTDLMPGGASDACTRVDWVEVYGRPVARRATPSAR